MNGSERHPHLADAPHVVYRLLDTNGDLLYIGCTVDPERRLAEHRRKPWGDEIAAWQFDEFVDAESAFLAERDAIASESPRYNAMHNGAGLTGWNDERRASDTCLHGHPWDENAKVNAQGVRICAECARVSALVYDAKRGRVSALARLGLLTDDEQRAFGYRPRRRDARSADRIRLARELLDADR